VTRPEETYHFPTGRRACEHVGYPASQLDRITPAALESFAGVGYPFAVNGIYEADTVLDIGSGSGTDLLLAALLVGPSGRAIGLDMTDAMRRKAESNARAMGLANVEVVAANDDSIPLPDASVDVVTSNGVINLIPDKHAAIDEIARVLRPGGRVQIADIVVRVRRARDGHARREAGLIAARRYRRRTPTAVPVRLGSAAPVSVPPATAIAWTRAK